MPAGFWTFSLRRLLVGVTVLCVLLALVVNFPEVALALVLPAVFFLPTAVVCAAVPSFSSRPRGALAIAIGGAMVGWLLAPQTFYENRSGYADWENLYSLELQTQAWAAAAGAFFLGYVWIMIFPRWQEPRR